MAGSFEVYLIFGRYFRRKTGQFTAGKWTINVKKLDCTHA